MHRSVRTVVGALSIAATLAPVAGTQTAAAALSPAARRIVGSANFTDRDAVVTITLNMVAVLPAVQPAFINATGTFDVQIVTDQGTRYDRNVFVPGAYYEHGPLDGNGIVPTYVDPNSHGRLVIAYASPPWPLGDHACYFLAITWYDDREDIALGGPDACGAVTTYYQGTASPEAIAVLDLA
jgi:hypothetical protein